MAKVQTLTARKDYPGGISKGDTYYKWSLRPGGRGKGTTYRSKTYPRPSQLTSSPFMSQALGAFETLLDVTVPDEGGLEERAETLEEAVQGVVDDLTSLKDETEGSLENMPEGLQQGPTGELLQERIDALEAAIDELEAIDWSGAEDAEELGGLLEEAQGVELAL